MGFKKCKILSYRKSSWFALIEHVLPDLRHGEALGLLFGYICGNRGRERIFNLLKVTQLVHFRDLRLGSRHYGFRICVLHPQTQDINSPALEKQKSVGAGVEALGTHVIRKESSCPQIVSVFKRGHGVTWPGPSSEPQLWPLTDSQPWLCYIPNPLTP